MKKRKWMGIEPTWDLISKPHNGFEIRGRHQACRHFRKRESRSPVPVRSYTRQGTIISSDRSRQHLGNGPGQCFIVVGEYRPQVEPDRAILNPGPDPRIRQPQHAGQPFVGHR